MDIRTEKRIDTRKLAREVRLTHWGEIIRARQESGETVRGYCQANGINEKSYYYWQRRLREAVCEQLSVHQDVQQEILPDIHREEPQNPALPMPTFAKIKLPMYAEAPSVGNANTATVTVRIGAYTAEIPSGVGSETVEQVLRVLTRL